jgi:iron complex transport system permease protein
MIKRSGIFLLVCAFSSICIILTAPFIGSQDISILTLLQSADPLQRDIFWDVRFARVVFAFLVGGSLAMVGAVFQALLRNDLATPYTLGVSSGGAFGAVLAIKTGLVLDLVVVSTTSVSSVIFSILTITMIYWIARERQRISIFTLILAGVAISFFFSAMILFVHYLADFTETYRMVRWLMGALDVTGWRYPLFMVVLVVPVFVYFFINANGYNLLITGDEMAMSKGLNVLRLQKRSFFLASILVGVIVSLSGPIGFVGLIIPHVIRLLSGPNHRFLLPGTFLTGGAFLVLCDTAARTLIYPAELPVGVITAIFGGPFFIYLLIRRRKVS